MASVARPLSIPLPNGAHLHLISLVPFGLIHLAALGKHVGDRRTEMPRLRRKAVLFVDGEMGLRHAGLDAVGAMIDEHAVLLG